MKKIFIRIVLVVTLAASAYQASAQKTGITFSFLNAAFYANASPFSQGYMGLGLERNVGDYISLKLEVNKGFQIMYNVTKGKVLGLTGSNGYETEWTDTLGNSGDFFLPLDHAFLRYQLPVKIFLQRK